MSEQKVVICKDLKSELQDFLSSLKYDKLFILMDTNTKEKCFPLVEDIPAFQKAPILVMEAGDMNKGFVSLAQIWTALSNEGAIPCAIICPTWHSGGPATGPLRCGSA